MKDTWHTEAFKRLQDFFEITEEEGLDRSMIHVAWNTFLNEVNDREIKLVESLEYNRGEVNRLNNVIADRDFEIQQLKEGK